MVPYKTVCPRLRLWILWEKMIFNVAGLITGSVGETLRSSFSDSFDEDDQTPVRNLTAEVELMRTDCTILATCEVAGVVASECVRCTSPISVEVPVKFEEEFWPDNFDLMGRKRTLPSPAGSRDFTIDSKNMLDLLPVVCEALVASMPIAPLCADCSSRRSVTVCLWDAEKALHGSV